MNLLQWQLMYDVSDEAMEALVRMSVIENTKLPDTLSEAGVTSRVRLEAAEHGVHLWRNNKGAGKVFHEDGTVSRFMRWGLMNDTKELGSDYRSHDWVGITPRRITVAMVGRTIGQFTSREIKRADWKWSNTEHERGQLAFSTLVNRLGGDAKIVSGPGSFG